MELATEKKNMLDLMLRPAFFVADGIIRHINPSAAPLMLSVGAPIAPLLASGQEEYASFSGDCLHLQLSIAGQSVDVTILQQEDGHLFLPDLQSIQNYFQLLNLVASQIREPLAGLIASSGQSADPKYAAHTSHYLHQLMRIVTNMSDAQRFSDPSRCYMEHTEICGFLEEILEKASTLMAYAGIQVRSQIPNEPIHTLLDREQMERAVYNLLSNAAKFGSPDKPITLQLTQQGQRLYLSVVSAGIPSGSAANFYSRFLREPALEDPANGIGLGMVLIRSAAVNHGGVVLIDHPDRNATRITMTFAIRHRKDTTLHSPAFRLDYAGERDHALLELADILPAELYEKE